MKRKHFFEIEDQAWFPPALRSYMTDVLMELNRKIGATRAIHHEIQSLIETYNFSTIVDLGSGSGGPMPEIIEEIRKRTQVELLLTDLYPNPKSVEAYEHLDGVVYRKTPMCASAPQSPNKEGCLMTMINSFHHMKPDMAQEILRSASKNQTPLFIYELADNKIPFLIWLLFLPLGLIINVFSCLILTLFVRPVQPLQLLFTYIIPIVPICFAWDGQISYTRIYTFDDIDILLRGNESPNYKWTKRYAKDENGRSIGTFVLGLPVKSQ